MGISERPTYLDDGDQTAAANCIKIAALTDRVYRWLIVLESDSYEGHCLLLAVYDLKHLQKAIFATTEQHVFLSVDKDAVARGALLLLYLFAGGEGEDGEVSIDVGTDGHELSVAEQDCPLGAVDVLNKIDVLFAVISQQLHFRIQRTAHFIENFNTVFMEYAKTSLMLVKQTYIATSL